LIKLKDLREIEKQEEKRELEGGVGKKSAKDDAPAALKRFF